MADQVSRMASDGLSASFMKLLMNFLVWNPGWPVVPGSTEKIDMWISMELDLLCSLGDVAWSFATMRAGQLENGETMATSRYVVVPF